MYLQCDNDNQHQALEAVIGERRYQDAKWGTIEDRPKQVGSYLTLMRKLLRDAEDNWATSDNDHGALDELRKVVAVGLACFEQHGLPTREQPVVEAPAPYVKPEPDPRLAAFSIEELDGAYERIRYVKPAITWTFFVDGADIVLTADQLYSELDARDATPIPF